MTHAELTIEHLEREITRLTAERKRHFDNLRRYQEISARLGAYTADLHRCRQQLP
ncbi:MAG: hypothetical protein AAFY15_04650 [Cyanobacteria bacterium J06648_11]